MRAAQVVVLEQEEGKEAGTRVPPTRLKVDLKFGLTFLFLHLLSLLSAR